jgi:hypothetical protein
MKVVLLAEGRLQTGVAVGLAALTGAVITVSTWADRVAGGRLALVGVALFAAGLALGRPRLVGVASLPVLGGALVAVAGGAETNWVGAIVLGGLWYLAVELAWEAIERRDGAERTSAYDAQRIDEITTVVALSCLITAAGALLSFLAPVRTVVVVGLVAAGLMAALRLATLRLRSGPGA